MTYEDRARFDAETGGSFMNLTPHIRIAVGKIYIARGKLVELAALTVATEKHLQKQDPLWDKYEIKGMWAEINRYHKALGREGKHYYDEALNTVIDGQTRSKNNRRKDQIAGKAAREAAAVRSLSASGFTEDAQSLLDQSLRKIGSGDLNARDLKELVYESRHRTRSSSHDLYTGSRKKQKSGASGKGQRRQTKQ